VQKFDVAPGISGERTDARLKTHEMRERDGEIQVCA
jgi:hypothetical protein